MNQTDNIRCKTGMPDLTLFPEQTNCVFFSIIYMKVIFIKIVKFMKILSLLRKSV